MSSFTKEDSLYKYDALPCYYEAFKDYYSGVWRGIKEIYNNQDEIINICYFRALSCFWYQSEVDFIDRQTLLYNYMSKDYNYKNENSLLNLHKSILPTDSEVKSILSEVCTAYDEPPRREFGNTTTDKKIKELYDEANVDSMFQDVYELANLVGVVAVAPVFIEGKMRLLVKTPDTFRIWTDPLNPFRVIKMVYPSYSEINGQIIYHEWTDSTYRILNYEGDPVSEEIGIFAETQGVNIYGKIPFVFLRLRHHQEYLSGGQINMIYNQLLWNKVKLGAENVATYNGFPVALGVNIGELDTLAPNKILGGTGFVSNEDVTPDLRYVTPEQIYDDLMQYRTNAIEQCKIDLGIPLGEAANASGIARILARQRLIENRLRDLPRLRTFEKEFAKMVVHIANIEGLFSFELDGLNFSINFAEERMYNDPVLERAEDLAMTKDGTLDIIDYLKKWSGFDNGISDEKIYKELEKRMERLERYNELVKGKEEPIEEAEIINPEEQPTEMITEIEDTEIIEGNEDGELQNS